MNRDLFPYGSDASDAVGVTDDSTDGADSADTDVCIENLCEACSGFAEQADRRLAHIGELADAAVRSLQELSVSALSESYRALTERSGIKDIGDRVALVRGLHRALGDGGMKRLCPDGLLGARILPTARIRVCYLQNSYSDIAVESFAPFLCTEQDGVQRVYCDSPEQACGEVEQGSAQYCVLPIENLSEGRLSGVERLIRRYDLHIGMTVSLMPRGMVFVLLRRSICRIGSPGDGELSYELLSDGEGIETAEIIYAARLLGLPLLRADSRHVDYDSRRLLHCLRFGIAEGDEESAETLGLLLLLEKRDYVPVGIYRAAERDISGLM